LPYTYTPDDPAQLQAIVTSPTAGAGAGVLTWAKTNWLKTAYSSTAPFIVAQPQNVTNAPGQSATFSVVVGGTGPVTYQWYFNTNTPVANATNSTLTLNNLQATNAGAYYIAATNAAGSVASTNAFLTVAAAAPARPRVAGINFSNGIFKLTVNGDAGPDYIIQASTNLITWQSLFTNHLAVPPFNWSDSNAASFSRRYYRIQLGP